MDHRTEVQLTTEMLVLLGVIAKHKGPEGWCYLGSKKLSEATDIPRLEVIAIIKMLMETGYLRKGEVNLEEDPTVIPVMLMEKANIKRVQLFNKMFPDIKSVLLRKP